jgi:hypothetical protein
LVVRFIRTDGLVATWLDIIAGVVDRIAGVMAGVVERIMAGIMKGRA